MIDNDATADAGGHAAHSAGRLYLQVIVAIAMPSAIWPNIGASLKPLGDGFVKLVRMTIAPLIFLTVTTGIAGLGEPGAFGRVAAKAFAYFLTLSTLALIVGLIVANVVRPGALLHIDPRTLDAHAVADYAAKAREQSLTGFLTGIIPDTLASPLAGGEILQVLLVAILSGIAIALVGERAKPLSSSRPMRWCSGSSAC